MSETALFSGQPYWPLPVALNLDKGLADCPENQHLIALGAPGTGKTSQLRKLAQTLVARHGANTVLALTPTREAAAELRSWLVLDCASPSAGPMARSISSFAFWILHTAISKSGKNPPRLLSGAGQLELISELVQQAKDEGLAGNWGIPKQSIGLAGFAQELRDLIAIFLEQGYAVEQVAELQQQFPQLKLAPVLDLLPRYRSELERQNLMDSAELLLRATATVHEQPTLVSNFKHYLVDDAQELTPAALAFVAQLAKSARIRMFADPDATALGFRGALGPELINATRLAMTEIKVMDLQDSLADRSQSTSELLVKLSNRITTGGSVSHRKLLENHKATHYPITAKVFPNTNQELDFVSTEIRKLKLREKLSLDQIVVIARTRPQLEKLQHGLASRGVATRIQGSQTALREQFASRSILNLALAILNPIPAEPELVLEILRSPFCGLDSIGIRRLLRQLSYQERQSGLARSQSELLAELLKTTSVTEEQTPEIQKLISLQRLIAKVRNSSNLKPHQALSLIWEESGLGAIWGERSRGNSEVAIAANRDLDSVLELFAAAKRFQERNPDSSALDFVDYQLKLAVPEDSLAPIGLQEAVVLATPSSLLGQRYQIGFFPRLQDGIWPNLRPRNSLLGAAGIEEYLRGRVQSPDSATRNELVDELRLLYKGVGTIARTCYFTAMQSLDEQPSQIFNLLFGEVPKPEAFVREFDLRQRVAHLRQRVESQDLAAAIELAALSQLGVAGADPAGWFGMLELSTNKPLFEKDETIFISPSKLEAFEECPLHWFISVNGGEGGGFEASLGTLIHAALEFAKQDSEKLQPKVDSLWHELEFEAQWQSTAMRQKATQMVVALSEYLKNHAGSLLQAEAEFKFPHGNLVISGKVDRLEESDAGVFVVDLKTGQVGTKEEVANNRQLALYQLAAQKVLTPDKKVLGAKIISVAEKLTVPSQPALEGKLLSEIEALLEKAEIDLAQSQLVAVVSEHCNKNGNCSMLLARQVTEIA